MESGNENNGGQGNNGQEKEAGQAAALVERMGALKGLVSEETVSEIGNEVKKLSTGVDKNNDKDTNSTNEEKVDKGVAGKDSKDESAGNENNNAGTKNVENKNSEKKEAPKNNTGDEKKNIFGLGKKKAADAKDDIVIENADQILGAVKSKFGQEYKEIKELPKFFETAQKWRADSQNLEKVKSQVDDYKNLLESLPAEFIEGMRLHVNGQDYMSAFSNKPKFDFSKSVDKQDVKDLVSHYYPNKFTEEDFKEEKPSELLQMAMDTSKEKYNLEKTNIDNRTRSRIENAQKAQDLFKQSVKSSVQELSADFPDTDQDAISEIQDLLEGGVDKIISVFLNKDGTVKKDAARNLMMAKHGQSQIEYMMGLASNQAESRANEDLVSRGADKPGLHKNNTGGENTPVQKELMEKIEGLKKLTKKTTFS